MTPIVRNADQKTISSISSEVLNLFFTIRDTNDPNLIDHLISRARLGLGLGLGLGGRVVPRVPLRRQRRVLFLGQKALRSAPVNPRQAPEATLMELVPVR